MNIDTVDAAEKEASEVLHSLLSVERIEKPVSSQLHESLQQQVLVVNCKSENYQQRSTIDRQQWNNSLPETVFTTLQHSEDFQNNTWKSSPGIISLDVEQSLTQDASLETIPSSNGAEENIQENYEFIKSKKSSVGSQSQTSEPQKIVKKTIRKRYKKDVTLQKDEQSLDSTVEDSAHEVRVRFRMGCECQDDCCFNGLNPENVYRHRLNIAELTKEEHDMYLMGVTMACMADPGVTAKQRKRRRLRAQYVYQGRRVCLSAFLYLENCTLYQLKRIRKHVMTHGVAPRVHGNHGKKPHNVFPLDTYRRATEFFKSCIEKYNNGSSNLKSPILFPAEMTRKTIHNLYKEMVMDTGPPGQKIMGYSTFRHFMKEQFPQVRFCKQETGSSTVNTSSTAGTKHYNNNNNGTNGSTNVVNHQQTQQPAPPVTPVPPHHQQHEQATPILTNCVRSITNHNNDICEQQNINVSSHPAVSSSITTNSLTHTSCPVSVAGSSILSSAQMTTIPVILSEPSKPDVAQQQTAFIVTPVSQLVQPFQAGHAITVTPITNTAYAFATL